MQRSASSPHPRTPKPKVQAQHITFPNNDITNNVSRMKNTYPRMESIGSTNGQLLPHPHLQQVRASPRLPWSPLCLHASHNCRYRNTSVADPQLYSPMFSQSAPSIGKDIQEIVFSLSFENKYPPTRCHNHARAYLSTTSSATL